MTKRKIKAVYKRPSVSRGEPSRSVLPSAAPPHCSRPGGGYGVGEQKDQKLNFAKHACTHLVSKTNLKYVGALPFLDPRSAPYLIGGHCAPQAAHQAEVPAVEPLPPRHRAAHLTNYLQD